MKGILLFVIVCCCNGSHDCYNLTRKTCRQGFVECEKGENYRRGVTGDRCVPESNVCDGHMDCSCGSDEKYCDQFNFGYLGFSVRLVRGPCNPDDVLCLRGHITSSYDSDCDRVQNGLDPRCYYKQWICDTSDRRYCDDNSDKLYCPYDANLKLFNFQFSRDGCPEDHYRCRTGAPKHATNASETCIRKSWICDTYQDCADNSDELYCPYFFRFPTREAAAIELPATPLKAETESTSSSNYDEETSPIDILYESTFDVTTPDATTLAETFPDATTLAQTIRNATTPNKTTLGATVSDPSTTRHLTTPVSPEVKSAELQAVPRHTPASGSGNGHLRSGNEQSITLVVNSYVIVICLIVLISLFVYTLLKLDYLRNADNNDVMRLNSFS